MMMTMMMTVMRNVDQQEKDNDDDEGDGDDVYNYDDKLTLMVLIMLMRMIAITSERIMTVLMMIVPHRGMVMMITIMITSTMMLKC